MDRRRCISLIHTDHPEPNVEPPDFDRIPLYTDGVGFGWVGYGMFDEWVTACFQIFDWKEVFK